VVGLGSMGKRRIRMLLRIMKGDSIFGIDTDGERRQQTEILYKIHCFDSLEIALLQNRYDAAFVCTSPLAHLSISRRLLKASINVFSEINLIDEGYDELSELAGRYHVLYFLSSTPMYRGEMQIISSITKRECSLTYNYHVGQFLPDWHPWETYNSFFVGDKRTNGCREIFAIELPWMVGAFGEIVDMQVLSKRSTDLNIDYNDTYIVTLTHESGNAGVFCVDVCCRKAVRHLEIYNQNLYITWEGEADSLQSYDLGTREMKKLKTAEADEHDVDYAQFINEYAYFKEVSAFFNCIKGEATPMHTLEHDKIILGIIDQIERCK